MLNGTATEAFFWGLISGFALIVGAFAGYYLNFKEKVIASIMAFGSGVFISSALI